MQLSPMETICMKCQILFSRKNITKCHLKVLPSMQSVSSDILSQKEQQYN